MKAISSSLRYSLSLLLIAILTVAHSGQAQTGQAAATARPSPDWLRSAVVYEVFPRNFSEDGTFNAITERLDDLGDMGVTLLWLMPIHPIGEKDKKGGVGSPYAVRDFRAINPDYGTDADFKRLVDEAHQRGIKVIIDIIEGHTSWDSVLMEHPEYYKKDENGNIISPAPGWTDVAALDYSNEELRAYMIDMLKFWMKEYGVDGFRCDVSFDVPMEFWDNARKELEAVNPEVVLLADAEAKPDLLVAAFDMDNSTPLHFALNRVMTGVSPATLLESSWEQTRSQFPDGALHMRFSDNHEQVRAVVRYGIPGALAAQVLMLTLDGVPLFYNGMEVADASPSSDPALFEKLPIFWEAGGRPPLRDIYRDLIKLRTENPAFLSNDVTWLINTAPAEVVSILREDENDKFVVLINLSSRPVSGTVTVPKPGEFKAVSIEGVADPASNDFPDFRLAGYEWRIYHRGEAEVATVESDE
jgi:glycosidase